METKTKKQSAIELMDLYNSYEVRKVKLSTILRKMNKGNNNVWRISGNAHNYNV